MEKLEYIQCSGDIRQSSLDKMLNRVVQQFNISCTQWLIEEDQLINLHAGVVVIKICVKPSHNNPTISS